MPRSAKKELAKSWIPATVVEVLGPVTYIVETDEGNRWKRHADQIKNWLYSIPRVTSETGNDHQDEDPILDLNSPELNEAEPPETDGLVAEGTLEAGGETDSSQDMDRTESPIQETGTFET